MAGGVVIAGLLHTVPALAATFDGMVAEAVTGVERQHVVDAWMLETAIRDGVTPQVQERVAAHLAHLRECGADAVLVTCSSIGEAAERAGAGMSIPVLRVDEPMAAEAVRLAGAGKALIAVFATNTATLGPTTRLIERYVAERGSNATVSTTVVEEAAAARASGDAGEHDRLIAEAVRRVADSAAVIVLAQASMADAASSAGLSVPVLTSPRSGVERLREVLTS
ncbi:aspartate/glutamate racemase family protein [Humibacter ginsengiterrae]